MAQQLRALRASFSRNAYILLAYGIVRYLSYPNQYGQDFQELPYGFRVTIVL